MALRRSVGACCGGSDPYSSLPLVPKTGPYERGHSPTMSESSGSSGSGGPPIPNVALPVALGVLVLLATANQWSRAIIFYVVDFSKEAASKPDQFINVALGFDEASYGLLASLAFSGLFAATGLLAGAAVDRYDARSLLVVSGALWSGAMLLQGHAASFGELLGSRVLLGFSQAFTNPAALCALAQIVPAQNRATVNGAYSSAVYLGGGIAALSVLIDGALGWRGLSYLAGGVGLSLALLTFVRRSGARTRTSRRSVDLLLTRPAPCRNRSCCRRCPPPSLASR
jgi:MFS family permease